jgi:hypothetical protein
VAVASGAYTVVFAQDAPSTRPVATALPGWPAGFPETSYGYVTKRWQEATSPVSLNVAGHATEFWPGSVEAGNDGSLVFMAETEVAGVKAIWRSGGDDVCVEMEVTARKDGYYSVASPSLVTLGEEELEWAMVPGVFAGSRFEHDLVRAWGYGQGLPEKPVLARERSASSLMSLVTTKSGVTAAVVAEPGTGADPWEKDRNSREVWKLGLSHMNRRGQLSPTLYHPVLGEAGSHLRAGESCRFAFRYVLRRGSWHEVLEHVARDIYRLDDFARLKRAERSLSDRLLSLGDYVRDPVLSRWRVEDYHGAMLGAQEYGSPGGKSNVQGSKSDAIKNSDYAAMWMLARATGDQALVRERLPYARAFKLAQQSTEPGFFQGAAIGQYYLYRSQQFMEEWGAYVEPVGLTYYALCDMGNIALFDPKDREIRERIRLAAERLLGWQRPDGSWEVAYDRRTGKPMFTDLVDYRPTFYGLLVAYQVLGDERYLSAARKGADWLVDHAVAEHRYLGVCGDTRFAPDFATGQVAQALLDLHEITHDRRYLDAGISAARFYATSVYTHPVASDEIKTVNGKPRHDWEISQVGLSYEHGGMIGSANVPGPILLASHAGLFVRVSELTGDRLLLDLARAGALGRDAFLDPKTRVATYYWRSMDAGAGSYPHHAWWQIGWITDYLVSEAQLRSGGRIRFPRGFFTPKVGPHGAYGFAAGQIFGDDVELDWDNRREARCEVQEVDWLLARSTKGSARYVVLLNDSPRSVTAKLAALGPGATLLDQNGRERSLETSGNQWQVDLSAWGLAVVRFGSR